MKRLRILLPMLLCIAALPSLAQEKTSGRRDAKDEYVRLLKEGEKRLKKGKFLEAEDAFHRATTLKPEEPKAHVWLGKARLKMWRYKEGRASLDRAHALDEGNVAAMIWLGRCELHDLEYVRSFRWLQRALEKEPENSDGLAVLSLLLIHLDDLDRAEEVGRKALARDPNHVLARICRAHLYLLHKKVRKAAAEFAVCVKKNRWSGGSYVGLSQALSTLNRPADSLRVLNEGLKRNRFLPTLYSNRGFIQFKLKRIDLAVKDYRRALAIDSEYGGGHGVYPFYPAAPADSRWPPREGKALLRAALTAMEKGEAETARDRARDVLSRAKDNVYALLVLGAAEYALDNPEGVLAAARKALALDAKAPLAHVLFLQGRGLKQELKKLELSKKDFYARFRTLDTPAVAGIRSVFNNFDSLTSDGRKVVLRAVAPLAHYIPKLKEEGVFHYLLPLYRHLTDVDAMSPWKGEKTFDGRYYDSVRGAAGKVAVTGVETLWPATRMGPSTLAHEFAHQVHRYALGGEHKSRLTRLYKKAKKAGRCLDYYAAENEQEYFAQGYEAFVSDFKRPTSSETGKHIRSDLKKKDPAFYAYLLEITRGWKAGPAGGK
ncbi:MAG: tetratricopeptide repeat protein [Planctomycetota bacterium]|jgi:tetratricopeptide (TPR) repeat protein